MKRYTREQHVILAALAYAIGNVDDLNQALAASNPDLSDSTTHVKVVEDVIPMFTEKEFTDEVEKIIDGVNA